MTKIKYFSFNGLAESSDEGVGSLSDASDEGGTELRQENEALRSQLDAERQRCSSLEERNRLLEAHFMPMLHVPTPSSGLRVSVIIESHNSVPS